MTDQPTHCPLCGELARMEPPSCPTCGLYESHWSRVRELAAVRDAAVEFYRNSTTTPFRFAAAIKRLFDLVRRRADRTVVATIRDMR
jgi:hypothetical protein